MENGKVDRRVRKTKALLRQSLTSLLKTKTVKDITVKELADLADMNRGTFYRHYRDIYDMLEQVEQDLFLELTGVLDSYSMSDLRGGLGPILRDIFRFVEKNADLCAALLSSRADSAFFQRLKSLIYDKCAQEWRDLYALRDTPGGDYCLDFLVSGCVGLVQSWVSRGLQEKPEDMATLAEKLIGFGIHPLADGCKAVLP